MIPNFVDLGRFHPDRDPARRRAFARTGEALLVHVSNFRPVKRSVAAAEVLARVVRERPAVLLMVGDGNDAKSLIAMAERMGLKQDVVFTHWVAPEKVPDFIEGT